MSISTWHLFRQGGNKSIKVLEVALATLPQGFVMWLIQKENGAKICFYKGDNTMLDRFCQEGIVLIDGIENTVVAEFSHPNTGVYAYQIVDAQDRVFEVPSEDVIFIADDFVDVDFVDVDCMVGGRIVEVISVVCENIG